LKNLFFNADFILHRNRNAWIDYVRGICIILVCYRHSFEGLNVYSGIETSYPVLKFFNVYFFSFRMPLFFLISGLFVSISLRKSGLRQFVLNRFKVLYYPLLIWGGLQITLQLIFKDYVNADRVPADYLNLIILPRKIEQFWYLNALFLVGVIFATVKVLGKLPDKYHIVLAIGLYFLGAQLYALNTAAFVFTDVAHYYIFFTMGYFFSNRLLKIPVPNYLFKPWVWLVASIIFFSVHYLFYLKNMEMREDVYVEHRMPVFFIIVSTVGCAYIIMVGKWLERRKVWPFLRVIGYHSLYIYVMHVMILAAIRVFFVKTFDDPNIYLLMAVAISLAVLIPILFYNFCIRRNLWWLFSLKKPDFSMPPVEQTSKMNQGNISNKTSFR
jgi:fucose 4-O-acetylase-like acetyltransferase